MAVHKKRHAQMMRAVKTGQQGPVIEYGVTPLKIFKRFILIIATLVSAWGARVAGTRGGITGFLAVVLIGSALYITIADPLPRSFHGKTVVRRLGGFTIALGSAIGLYSGGWQMGWFYGLACYIVGIISMLFLAFVFSFLTSFFNLDDEQ